MGMSDCSNMYKYHLLLLSFVLLLNSDSVFERRPERATGSCLFFLSLSLMNHTLYRAAEAMTSLQENGQLSVDQRTQ